MTFEPSTISTAEPAATGIEGLDTVLGGGLPRQHIYLLEGESGTGKTTLALQFVLTGVVAGEPGLYITTAETEHELHGIAASHGWSLDKIRLLELSTQEDDAALEEQYTLFHPAEIELNESTQKILAEVDRLRPTRVVIDALSGLQLLAADPLRHRRQVETLRRALTQRACTVVMIEDETTPDRRFQPRSLAHGIIQLQQIAQEYGPERRRLRIMKLRGIETFGGFHDFRIKTGGLDVYPRLVATQHAFTPSAETVSSGVAELDTLVGGGPTRGSSMKLIGPSGTGKSTLALQYAAAAAARQEHSAIYLFDEQKYLFIERARALSIDLRAHIDAGLTHVQQVNPAEMSPGEFAHHIRTQVERYNLRLIVIDSINGYLHAMPQERFLTLHMQELFAYLSRRGVLILLVMVQYGLLGAPAQTPVDLTSIIDTVLLLRFFEAMGETRQSVAVLKKRMGGHERSIREIRIGPGGLRVGQPLKDFQGVLTSTPRYVGPAELLLGEQP